MAVSHCRIALVHCCFRQFFSHMISSHCFFKREISSCGNRNRGSLGRGGRVSAKPLTPILVIAFLEVALVRSWRGSSSLFLTLSFTAVGVCGGVHATVTQNKIRVSATVTVGARLYRVKKTMNLLAMRFSVDKNQQLASRWY